jgi:hypothetical protein
MDHWLKSHKNSKTQRKHFNAVAVLYLQPLVGGWRCYQLSHTTILCTSQLFSFIESDKNILKGQLDHSKHSRNLLIESLNLLLMNDLFIQICQAFFKNHIDLMLPSRLIFIWISCQENDYLPTWRHADFQILKIELCMYLLGSQLDWDTRHLFQCKDQIEHL